MRPKNTRKANDAQAAPSLHRLAITSTQFFARYSDVTELDVTCPHCRQKLLFGVSPKDTKETPWEAYGCSCACLELSEPPTEKSWGELITATSPKKTTGKKKQKKVVAAIAGVDITVAAAVVDPLETEAATINGLHHELFECVLNALERMIVIGGKLAEIKEKVPYGSWQEWMRNHLDFNERTAQRYLKAYRYRNDPLVKADPGEFIEQLHGKTVAELPSPAEIAEVNKELTKLNGLLGITDTGPDKNRHRVGSSGSSSQSQSAGDEGSKIVEMNSAESVETDEVKSNQKLDKRSYPKRWTDACHDAEFWILKLLELQSSAQDWLDNLSEDQAESATAKTLQSIVNLPLADAVYTIEKAGAIDLPRGFASRAS